MSRGFCPPPIRYIMPFMQPSPDTIPVYHFLLVASNLGAEWLFDAARAYWERFRPIVISDMNLARLLPPEDSAAVTLIARRDTVAQWGVTVAQAMPAALFDPVVYDSFDDMKQALNTRAALNQPFGVPLAATPTSPPPVTVTPGSILGGPPPAQPTRPPAGFVTETPLPDQPASPPDTPTPDAPSGPVYPTPGPITGG